MCLCVPVGMCVYIRPSARVWCVQMCVHVHECVCVMAVLAFTQGTGSLTSDVLWNQQAKAQEEGLALAWWI